MGSLESPAVTTRGPEGEPYDAFTRRVAEDNRRVKAKVDALDRFTPYCSACGQTCEPKDAGTCCKQNNMQMASRWARKLARVEFYRLGNFADGAWSSNAHNLACLLDRVRAGAEDGPTPEERSESHGITKGTR